MVLQCTVSRRIFVVGHSGGTLLVWRGEKDAVGGEGTSGSRDVFNINSRQWLPVDGTAQADRAMSGKQSGINNLWGGSRLQGQDSAEGTKIDKAGAGSRRRNAQMILRFRGQLLGPALS